MLLSFYFSHPEGARRRAIEVYSKFIYKKNLWDKEVNMTKLFLTMLNSFRSGLLENSDSTVLFQFLYNLKQASC